jgi:hypothetical protein
MVLCSAIVPCRRRKENVKSKKKSVRRRPVNSF